eukprot:TRINITY_DN15928_c0_g1_i1.p1 TRINITY_DN15928_c0_g1~~TRINITY_DN15928_c0_g1_i1.p1  ORF type:complete len:139 (+),score=2.75 TRINITY_DN15928_c0_g1_i1:343-759(+)
MYESNHNFKRFRRFCISCLISLLVAEPEVVKLKRDAIDFEEYGGTVAPRSNSVLSRNHKQSVSLREYRADQYDFTEAMPRWVNRDAKQDPAYKFLSTKFKKLFDNSKVAWDLYKIGKGCCNTYFWVQRIHARISCTKP